MENPILYFKPKLHGFNFIEEEKKLTFFNQKDYITFSGKSVQDILLLLPLLNGKYTTETIAEKVEFPIEYTCQIIELLISKNIVKNYDLNKSIILNDKELKRFENFMIQITGSYASFHKDLERNFSRNIIILGNDELKSKVREVLGNVFNIIDIDNIERAHLIIGIDFCENKSLFKQVDELSQKYNIPFLRALIENETFTIGPLFIPNKSSCYSCYLSRSISNLENPKLNNKYREKNALEFDEAYISLIPGTIEILAYNMYSFIWKYFANNLNCEIIGKEYTFNVYNLESSLNPVLKVPGCQVCGNKTLAKEFVFNS